mgnify:CR=1
MDDSSLIASFSLKDESLLARKIVDERMRKWHLGKKDNWVSKGANNRYCLDFT